jgi:HEAT repeat protein
VDEELQWKIRRLIYQLSDSKSAESAREELIKISKPAVPELIEALKKDNISVRYGAAVVLGKIGIDGEQFEIIAHMLKHGNEHAREGAARALGEIRRPSAFPGLTGSLEDENSDVRRHAAISLAKIGGIYAVPVLIEALECGSKNVRESVPYALKKIAEVNPKSDEAKEIKCALVKAIEDESPKVREDAAYALGSFDDIELVQVLVKALGDKNEDVRSAVACVLEKIVENNPEEKIVKDAAPGLIEAMNDEYFIVKEHVAHALGIIGDRSAVPALARALEDEYENVRKKSARALWELGIDELNTDEKVRCLLILGNSDSLAVIEEDIFPLLIEALGGKDLGERTSAVYCIKKTGVNDEQFVTIVHLLKHGNGNARKGAVDVLEELEDRRANHALIEALEDEIGDVRCNAARALGKTGDASTVPALIKLLKDEKDYVRINTFHALKDICDGSAIPHLVEALEDVEQEFREIAQILVEFVDTSFEAVNDAYLSGKISHEAADSFYQALNKRLEKENFEKGTVAPPRKPPGNPDEMKRIALRRMANLPRHRTQNRRRTLRGAAGG